MRSSAVAAALAGAMLLGPPALAADNQAGIPLQPADAAGPWTLQSAGHAICVVSLGQKKTGASGFALKAPAACGDALPAGVAGWTPTAHGMSLVGADGQTLMGFSRWSNSLLVSHRASGVDIQLQRGGPKAD
jgi:hypothetical protein